MRFRVALGPLGAAAVLVGCASPPSVNVEADVSRAAGLSGDITLSIDELPLDEPGLPGGALSLTEAVSLAVRGDPGLQAALARARIAAADAVQARLWPNPILAIAVRFPEGGGRPAIEAGLAADLLQIVQTPTRSRAADYRLREAGTLAVGRALDVIEAVRTLYADAQTLDRQAPLLAARAESAQRLLTIARRRLAAGESNRLDVLAFESDAAALDVQLGELKRRATDTRLRLARMIGTPNSPTAWRLDPWTLSSAPPDEPAAVASALGRRPEVLSHVWALAALGESERLSRWTMLENPQVGAEAQRDGAWELGPSASAPIPLFDTGTARRDRARSEVVEARHLLTLARRQAVEDVRRASASARLCGESLDRIGRSLIPSAQARLDLAKARFEAGESDSVAVLMAEQDLLAAQSTQIDLEHEVALSHIRLERAIGGPADLSDHRLTAPSAQQGNTP